jgi:hypothetical protein
VDVGPLDLLSFDACLMGMIEVAYEIREYADIMVGSEENMTHGGLPYHTILADLKANPFMSAAALGDTIVMRHRDCYAHLPGETQSAMDLFLVDTLAAKAQALAQALRACWSSDAGLCAAASYDVMAAVNTAVISEAHGSSSTGSHGVSIYFPNAASDLHPDYDPGTILFPGSTLWDMFLSDFYSYMGGTWVETARNQTQGYFYCSAPANYCYADLYDFCEKLIENAAGILWVNFAYAGPPESGTYHEPYNTLGEAVTAAGSGETICILSGTSPEILTINKAVTLRACGGSVTIGVQP